MDEARAVNGTGKMVAALLSLAVIFAGEVLGLIAGMVMDADLDISMTLGGAIIAVLAIIMLGGRNYLRFDGKAMFETWKFMWWIVAISAFLMVLDLFDYVSSGELVHEGWALRLFSSLILCLGIGISEEGMFRGALFGGLLARLGGKKNGILWAVVISSLAFGFAHITLDDFDPNNLLTFVQAGLKVCQTGMYAVMLCAVVLKTKNLMGAMMVHAIDDWLLFVVSTGLYGEDFVTEYVTPDYEEAIATIVLYLVICALYLPTFIKAVLELRAIQAPQFGPFVGEDDVVLPGQQGTFLPAGQGYVAGVPAVTPGVPVTYGYMQQDGRFVPVQMPQQQVVPQQAVTQWGQVPQQPVYQPQQAGQPAPQPGQQMMQPIQVVYYPVPVPAEPLLPDSTMQDGRPIGTYAQGVPIPLPVEVGQPDAAQAQQPSAMPIVQVVPQQQMPQQAMPTQWPTTQAGQRPPAPDGL